LNIKVVKSNEIDNKTWQLMTLGFNKSFDRDKATTEFVDYYQNTIFGYSYHALGYNDDGELMGSTTVIPQYYSVNGKQELFGLSGGSYVLEEYRKDIFIFYELVTAIRKYCQAEGVKIIVGVPNKNSFRYAVKFLSWNYLMDLDYYAIPFKFGNTINSSKPVSILNLFSKVFFLSLFSFNSFLSLFLKIKANNSPVSIEFNEAYKKIRFKKGYETATQGDFFIAYKLVVEKGVKTVYLIEYREKNVRSFKALTFAINQINKKQDFDLVLFIGTFNHFQSYFFKIPFKKQPQRFPLTYDVLGDIDIPLEIIKKSDNWDFSLVNFDVR
jgi:hypothetical protein